MKVRPLYILFAMIFAGITFFSCKDKPVYPSEPVIAYKDFLRYGNDPSSPDSVELVVSFTDNEGDIGFDQADTNGIFGNGDSLKYGNFWMIDYYWDTAGGTGHWTPFDNGPPDIPPIDTHKIAYRVPLVLPDGDPSEPMKGLIYVKQKNFAVLFPRMKYVAYMFDKAKHKSNVIETPPIDF